MNLVNINKNCDFSFSSQKDNISDISINTQELNYSSNDDDDNLTFNDDY